MISIFHKGYLEKSIAKFLFFDFTPCMAKLMMKFIIKQICGGLANLAKLIRII